MEDTKNPFDDFQVVTSLDDLNLEDPTQGNPDPTPNPGGQDQGETPIEVDPQAQAYFELLREEGIISVPEEFEFDGTFDGIKKAQEYTYQQQFDYAQQNLINSMPEKLRTVVQAGLNGVEDLDQIISMQKDIDIQPDITSEAAQKSIIRRELSGTISEEDLDELIDLYVDKGKLKTEAEKIVTRRQEQASQRIKQMQQQALQQKQLQEQQMQQFAANISQEINAQQWDRSRKQVVMNEINGSIQGTPVIEAKLQRILSDPKHVVTLADFLTYFDGAKFDLDKYRKLDSLEAEHLKNKWASKLSDTPVTLSQRQQQSNRGAVNLDDFQLYLG